MQGIEECLYMREAHWEATQLHLTIYTYVLCAAIYGISSSISRVPALHHCESADSSNVMRNLPHNQTMEKGYPLCSKRCLHGRSFSHSWFQQSTSRLQGKKKVSQRHTIQLNLIIKAEKEFGFCSSVEAQEFEWWLECHPQKHSLVRVHSFFLWLFIEYWALTICQALL